MGADNKLWREWVGTEPVTVAGFVPAELKAEIQRLVEQIDINDYLHLEYHGIPIGRWVSDVIRNNYMVGDDRLVPDLAHQVRHFLCNILVMIEGCEMALDSLHPDVIVSNDSYYYQWAILEELARRHEIPFYSHWQGGRRLGWCYAFNEPAMELNLREFWPSYKALPLLPHEERIVDDFLQSRPSGKTMTLNTADPKANSDSHIAEALDFTRPTALLAANVIWDLAALNREVQFKDMIDWVCSTIEFFRNRPDWQLVVKPHPGELNKSLPATRQLLAEEVCKRVPQLPPNVVICSPLTNLSVYDIIPKVRFGLVFTSTVGLEMACQGVPVVTAGRSLYHGMGFTFDPPTPREYYETLDTLMSGRKTIDRAERSRLARKFAYLYLFRYYTSLNLFDHSYTGQPTLLISDASGITPGANDVLDYVCDSILGHRPIVSAERIPPLAGTRRGSYLFTREETLAAAALVLDGYGGDNREEVVPGQAGMTTVRLAGSDFTVPNNLFKNGELAWIHQEVQQPAGVNPHAYEQEAVTIRGGDVVVDAGACVGFFTRKALARSAARVYAFEPLPVMADALEMTFAGECRDGRVVVERLALTNYDGSACLNNGEQFICEARLTSEGTNNVQTVTLDSFVRSRGIQRIDFIKMDVEGEEMNAIAGALETINRFRPRLSIAVYHEYANAAQVRDLLQANCPGYRVRFGGRYMFDYPHRPYMVYAFHPAAVERSCKPAAADTGHDTLRSSTVPHGKVKVLFTTPLIEHPPASGPALRIENSIKALNQVSELHVAVRTTQNSLGGVAAEEFYRSHCHFFAYTPHQTGSGIPEHELDNARAIVQYAREQGIGVIWCGFGNISYNLMKAIKELDAGLKVICDTDSVWSRFVLRELPLVHDQISRRRIENEGKAKEQEEAEWVNFCDITTAVSEVDAEYYRNLAADPGRIQLFSNVIDLDSYATPPSRAPEMRSPSLYLAGSFYSETSPMARAARWVIDEVLPLVQRVIPAVTLHIIGNGADRMLADIRHSNVVIKGKVPSVLPYLCHADVALVPLMFESGTRFKIMEAAACNVPIVSTTLGAEGIPVVHGTHCMIADDPEGFCRAILSVLGNPALADNLRSNCRMLVEQYNSIASLTKEAVTILDRTGDCAAAA
jgi:FkbM family methyltransferase